MDSNAGGQFITIIPFYIVYKLRTFQYMPKNVSGCSWLDIIGERKTFNKGSFSKGIKIVNYFGPQEVLFLGTVDHVR